MKIIKRLIAAPFVLCLLTITYSYQLLRHWIGFIKHGGEWITYGKDDPKRLNEIFYLLKDKHKW